MYYRIPQENHTGKSSPIPHKTDHFGSQMQSPMVSICSVTNKREVSLPGSNYMYVYVYIYILVIYIYIYLRPGVDDES